MASKYWGGSWLRMYKPDEPDNQENPIQGKPDEPDEPGRVGKPGKLGSLSHYYTSQPQSESRRATVTYELPRVINSAHNNSNHIIFVTDSGVFAKRRVDFGTDLLIRSLPPLKGRALDFGCGYGAAGISLKLLNPCVDMWFSDINQRAVELCRENYTRLVDGAPLGGMLADGAPLGRMLTDGAHIICSDGLTNLGGAKFDNIFTNPPVRAGKTRIFQMYGEAREALNPGGALYLVIQKKQGMESTRNKLIELFGNCTSIARKAGYHVLCSYKI